MKGEYIVLVVPKSDVEQNGCTIPPSYNVPNGFIRVAAVCDRSLGGYKIKGNKKKTLSTIKKLRRLADWLEENVNE